MAGRRLSPPAQEDKPMRPALVLAAALSAALAHAQVPETMDAAAIPNYKVIAPGLAAAGQPAADELPKLGSLGFKTVINLRTPGEGGPANEKQLVESQGLRYVSVPITPASFSLADVEAVQKVLDDASAGPMLRHCASSNRVGATWAAVLARRGKPLDEALAAGRDAGMRSAALEDAVRRVLATGGR
jgi:uncharacterized protein (TIGR01244 family)